jgi:hypothetical protein
LWETWALFRAVTGAALLKTTATGDQPFPQYLGITAAAAPKATGPAGWAVRHGVATAFSSTKLRCFRGCRLSGTMDMLVAKVWYFFYFGGGSILALALALAAAAMHGTASYAMQGGLRGAFRGAMVLSMQLMMCRC